MLTELLKAVLLLQNSAFGMLLAFAIVFQDRELMCLSIVSVASDGPCANHGHFSIKEFRCYVVILVNFLVHATSLMAQMSTSEYMCRAWNGTPILRANPRANLRANIKPSPLACRTARP